MATTEIISRNINTLSNKRDRVEKNANLCKRPRLVKENIQKEFTEILKCFDRISEDPCDNENISLYLKELPKKVNGLYCLVSEHLQLNPKKQAIDKPFEDIMNKYCVHESGSHIKASEIKYYLSNYVKSLENWDTSSTPDWLSNTRNFSEPMIEYINHWVNQSDLKKWKDVYASRSGKGVATIYNVSWKKGKSDTKIVEDMGPIKQKRQDYQEISQDSSEELEDVDSNSTDDSDNIESDTKTKETISNKCTAKLHKSDTEMILDVINKIMDNGTVVSTKRDKSNIAVFVNTNVCPLSKLKTIFGCKFVADTEKKEMKVLCSKECQCRSDHKIRYDQFNK